MVHISAGVRVIAVYETQALIVGVFGGAVALLLYFAHRGLVPLPSYGQAYIQ